MKSALLLLVALALSAGAPSAALAQASAPAASPPQKPPTPPPPRRLSAEELREVGGPPGEVRPQDPVIPQIKVPLGKKQPVTPPPPARSGSAAAAGGIDDAAARCLALTDAAERAACGDKTRRARRSPG